MYIHGFVEEDFRCDWCHRIFSNEQNVFLALESLTLSALTPNSFEFPICAQCPALTSLTIRDIYSLRLPDPSGLIRHATILGTNSREVYRFLTSNPLVETLEIGGLESGEDCVDSEDFEGVPPKAPMILSELRTASLVIDYDGWLIHAFVFLNLHAPLLRSFMIQADWEYLDELPHMEPAWFHTFVRYVQGCALHYFDGIHPLTQAINSPDLTSISIFGEQLIANAILSCITSHAHIFPNLRNVRIDCKYGGKFGNQLTWGVGSVQSNRQYSLIQEALEGAIQALATVLGPKRDSMTKALDKLILVDCPKERRTWLKAHVVRLRIVKRYGWKSKVVKLDGQRI